MDTETIISIIKEDNPSAKFLDGLDKALIGQAQVYGMKSVAAYDYEKCLYIYAFNKEVDAETAREIVDGQVVKSCFEKNAPVMIRFLK